MSVVVALPSLVRKSLKWLYGAAIVVVGFAGHALLSDWHEDWSESLPPHQVERYVTQVRNGDTTTIEKLLSFAQHEDRSVRSTAAYLLDRGGALERLDRPAQVDYLVRRLGSPWEFATYETDDPQSSEMSFDSENRRQLLHKLWRHRDLADSIAARHASIPGQFDEVLRQRWSTRWLYVADRARCANVLMNHLSVALAAHGRGGQNSGNQSRRNMELLHAVPLLAWLVTYTAHMPDEASSAPEQRLVSQGGSLIDWWQAHEALTQQQREAEAIDVLLQQGPPTGEKRRYAQWLLNRPLGELGESQWRALREHGSGRSRLEWVTDGFRQAGFAVEAPWDADDVELLLSILGSAGEVDRSAWPDWLAANALWLLERLATQQPPPSSTEWIGPLVRSPAAEERDWKIQAARWNDWWRGAERAVLRDPAEPLW